MANYYHSYITGRDEKVCKKTVSASPYPSLEKIKMIRPVAGGGGGGGGVPTPPSEINDIHNFNYLIQERPLILIVSSLASEPQVAPEALSWHKNL